MRQNILYFFLLLLLGGANVYAQSFQDDFSDGDFTSNPQWSGDDALFTINSSNQLQSQSGSAAIYYLSTPSTITADCRWEFSLNLKLSTSGSNYVDVYLMSDASDLNNTNNGYFVRLGGTADEISLYKIIGGTETVIIDGADGLINSSSNNPFKIRVERTTSNEWQLEYDDLGANPTNGFVLGGTVTDAAITASTHWGVKIKQSSAASAVNKHFFNYFKIDTLVADLTAPNLTAATVVSATAVDLLFDEPLESTSANTIANYNINNGITVTNAQQDGANPALVHLTVSALTNQTTYQVTANNIKDLAGNAMSSQSANFTYVLILPAVFQDIIFNEIMIDPNPVVNLPNAEFIELYNRSNNAINLENYELMHRSASSGTETRRTLGAHTILPGEYLLLHNDVTYSTIPNSLQIPSFPALNNTSAYLILRDDGGTIIDSILYTKNWYQDNNKDDGGWSIELINPNLVCKGGDNWKASNDVNGGTPASANSVLDNTVDATAPVILEARQSDVNKAVLRFDDILDVANASNVGNYSITGGLSIVFAELLDQYTVELTFNINMSAENTYTITANNVSDCVGNSATRNANFTYYELGEAEHYDILINEIFSDVNPTVGLPEKEYVELYNRSSKSINLENYEFTDGTTNIAVFPFYILKPNEYLIIYKVGDGISYSNFGAVLEFNTFPDLDVGSDDLVLTDASGRVVDAVSYSNTWYGDGDKADGGWSLERINPNRPCEGRKNWLASNAQPPTYDVVGGTPGQANSLLQTDLDNTAPDVIRAYPFAASSSANSDSIRLYFSEAMGDSSAINIANYTLDNGLNIIDAYLEPPFYNTVVVITDIGLSPETIYTLSMTNGLTDCVGNSIALKNEVQFALPEAIETGDLILNEILFDPVTGGDDYIELYNKSDKVLSLLDLWVANTQEDDLLLNDANNIGAAYLLFPKTYTVIATEPEEIELVYRTSDPLKTPDLNKIVEFNLPSFANDEGTVVLYTVGDSSQANFIDHFTYSEDYHSPLIDDLNGVALERIDFDAPTNDANNWHSAAQPVNFGTPTYQNSSALNNEITDNDLIQLPTEIFSPDNDGFEDFLLINYNIDAIGFAANISIYDAQGRLTKQLINNELLLPEGTIQWDGSTDKGEKALIGPYIIFIELFDPNGNVKRYKKTCVVAGQLD